MCAQGGTLCSLLLFDLFVRRLPREVQHTLMLCYADEAKKTKAITISRKRDPDGNPPLVKNGSMIAENKTLKS